MVKYLKAVSLWNKKQREVNTAHVYAVPRKGTKEYDQVRGIMGVKDFEKKSEAVEKAREAGKAMKARRPAPAPTPAAYEDFTRLPSDQEDTRRGMERTELDLLLELSRRLQDYVPPTNYVPPRPRSPSPEREAPEPQAPRRRTKRGEILAQNPEYARFYEFLTAPQRNALNVRRRDYISRLKMSPAEAMREAMQRHPLYDKFKREEEAEL